MVIELEQMLFRRKRRREFILSALVVVVIVLVAIIGVYWWISPGRRVKSLLNQMAIIEREQKPLIHNVIPPEEGDWRKKLDELVSIGPQAIGPLTEALRHRDPRIRCNAAKALAQISDSRATDSLIVALKDEYIWVRYIAVLGLGKHGGEKAAEALIAMMKDKCETGTIDKWIPMQSGSGSGNWIKIPLRVIAADKLGNIGNRNAVEALAVVCKDTDEDLSNTAFAALGRIADDRALEVLVSYLKDGNREIRNKAAHALGMTRRKEAVEPLIEATENDNLDAVISLGNLGDRRAVRPLITILQHNDAQMRSCAAEALGKLGDPVAVKPLKILLEDDSVAVRKAAIEAIRRIRIKGVRNLLILNRSVFAPEPVLGQ